MKLVLPVLLAIGWLTTFPLAAREIAGGSLDVHWNEGSKDCKASPRPPLQVHPYNSQTFILRQNLCVSFEGNFIYLLVGSKRALLIDTGAVADPKTMPLAETVMHLLPGGTTAPLPLLVVHTHRHLDHRAGDPQFEHLDNVQVVGYDLQSVRRFYHFSHWPDGVAHIDLGDRIVDVVPTPGHEATHVVFYDRNTALLFSGDFMMPGRLLIDDKDADLASAKRVAAFVRDRPVRYVLGAHIEMNTAGKLFPWGSTYHPDEHVLQMTKADLLALPAAIEDFNGFYTESGEFTLIDPLHNLIAVASLAGIVLGALMTGLVLYFRRRRDARRAQRT